MDLDAPVRKYVPELKLADPKAQAIITPRHLLSHSSGIQGDYFEDHGRGDDCIERYVASLSQIGHIHAPDAMFSYCNSGFTLAGRLIEKVTGLAYHEALQQRLLGPLGLRSTTVLADEMLAHPYAVGHVRAGPRGTLEVPPRVLMARSSAPAGSLTSATPGDVLGFVQLHLNDGRSPEGTVVLSAHGVRQMQEPTYRLPGVYDNYVGLGWMLQTWSGERVLGHTGGTIGQLSFLQVMPDRPFAVFLATNSETGAGLWKELGRWLFAELVGVEKPGVPRPGDKEPALELSRYVGCYERLTNRCEVTLDGDCLMASVTSEIPSIDTEPRRQRGRLYAVDATDFYVVLDGTEMLMSFSSFDSEGRPGYLHLGSRASRRQQGVGDQSVIGGKGKRRDRV